MISNFKFQISNSQRGITLIITFMIMSIMLAIVLGVSTVLYHQMNLTASIGNSLSAFYAAESGIEKTLYLAKTCAGCNLNDSGAFDDRTYSVTIEKSDGVLHIFSTGEYGQASRTIEYP